MKGNEGEERERETTGRSEQFASKNVSTIS